MRGKSAGNQGCTLLEWVFALGIFSLGFTALMHWSVSSMKADRNSRHRTVALQLAQEKLEILKGTAFEALQSEQESGLSADACGVLFQRETVIAKDPAGKWADITVRVSWPSLFRPSSRSGVQLYTRIAP